MRAGEYFHEAFHEPYFHFWSGAAVLVVGMVLFEFPGYETAAWIALAVALPLIADPGIWMKIADFSFLRHPEIDDPLRDAFRPRRAVLRYIAFSVYLIAIVVARDSGLFRAENDRQFMIFGLLPLIGLLSWIVLAQRADCRRYAEELGIAL